MVCYRPPSIESVPIIDAVNRLSTVDPDGSAVLAARAMGISFGEALSPIGPFCVPAESTSKTAPASVASPTAPTATSTAAQLVTR